MPEQMAAALDQLKYAGLDPKKQVEYVKEVEAVDTYANELDRIAAESKKEGEKSGFDKGKQEGELKGKLESLLDGFIDFDFRKIPSTAAKSIRDDGKLFPQDLVGELGANYVKEKKISQKQLKDFIELLKENGILVD
jgi:hypothetical protein